MLVNVYVLILSFTNSIWNEVLIEYPATVMFAFVKHGSYSGFRLKIKSFDVIVLPVLSSC